MKKIFCLAFVLLIAVGIFAQEKSLEKAEFDAVMKNSYRKFAGQAYRRTENSHDISTETNKNKTSSKSVMEFTFAPASRWVYEFDSPTVKTKRETITIGGKTYTRTDDGEWTEGKREPAPRPDSKLKTVEEQTEYKSLGTEVLDNQKTSVYVKIERKKLVVESEKKEMLSVTTIRYWLGEDGGIIKQEVLTENRMKSEKNPVENVFRHVRTTVWELDPNIKIEAPSAAK